MRPSQDLAAAEKQLLDVLRTAGKQPLSEEQNEQVDQAVALLEADGGIPRPTLPTAVPSLDGLWKLLWTSRPGTASPIQRTFTSVDAFSVFQEIDLTGEEARVNNIVRFGTAGYLKVEAQASTDSRPLQGFTPREGAGDFLWGVFGKSTSFPPARPDSRIDFQFDQAAFYFSFLPFSIPYPVPFKLLGDERKGFIDITYQAPDGMLRLSRGNKGSLFVLQRPAKEQLSVAIAAADDDRVLDLCEELEAQNPTPQPARSPLAAGTWRLIFTVQSASASALQKWGTKQARAFQIINTDGSVRNRVELGFVQLTARGECEPESDTRTSVAIQEAGLVLGEGALDKPIFLRFPGRTSTQTPGAPGWIDWLYLDEDLRITRGNKGSLFIHRRVPAEDA